MQRSCLPLLRTIQVMAEDQLQERECVRERGRGTECIREGERGAESEKERERINLQNTLQYMYIPQAKYVH